MFKATLDGVQTVAVKQLLEQNEYQQHKFVNEIAILRSCRNENIVCFLGEQKVIPLFSTAQPEPHMCRQCCIVDIPCIYQLA